MTDSFSSNPISFKCLGVCTERAKVSPTASWNPNLFMHLLSDKNYLKYKKMVIYLDWLPYDKESVDLCIASSIERAPFRAISKN